jgi:hypothetical protein
MTFKYNWLPQAMGLIYIILYKIRRYQMARKWPKGKIPDDTVERLKLASIRAATTTSSSPEERKRVDQILNEWASMNILALALGVHLTKHDYREFMLRKIGVKG